jgi:hypothetical protein
VKYQYQIIGGIGLATVIVVMIVAQQMIVFANDTSKNTSPPQVNQEPISSNTENNNEKILETNGVKHLVPLDKIRSGGPPKDGIPSIDDPKFAKAEDAAFMSDDDIVIGLEINGDARAYPLFILVWHEIVNDKVGNTPVAVTYCPLCYTNQVFKRVIDGKEVEFGTSGKLYNSNLVMYDRLTDTYWSQALGQAIKGELTGLKLDIIPFDVIFWADWKKLHPDTIVLTTDTGHARAYAVDPYGDYYTNSQIVFPVENRDDRIHPKEIILGFEADNIYKAYKQKDVESSVLFAGDSRAFDRVVDDMVLEFEYIDGKIFDVQTNSEWNYDGLAVSGELAGAQLTRLGFNPGFWFEWVAFHPQTEVYEK